MKFNWGHGIFIGIILFVGFILYLVYITTQQNLNLVSEDYYPKELLHQDQMDRIKNTVQFEKEFDIIFNKENIKIKLPEYFDDKNIDASIHFYRPSNNHLDIINDFKGLGVNVPDFPLNKFQSGIYMLKITWICESKEYYFEKELAFDGSNN